MRHASHKLTRSRGFTLVELLVSILIIGILLGLLIVGARAAIRYTRTQADRAAVVSMRTGAIQFKQDMGILMPLVRDQHPSGSPPLRARVEDQFNSNLKRIAVYDIAAQPTTLGDDYRKMLSKAVGYGDAPPNGWGAEVAAREYYDVRWSENSLAFYLVGALEVQLDPNPTQSNTSIPYVPIDGRSAYGMMPANRNGTFKVPAAYAADAEAKVALPKTVDAYFSPNNSSTAVWVDASGTPRGLGNVQIRDRKGIAFRYYAWLHDEGERSNNDPDPSARLNRYLRVPKIVGDPFTDTRLRNARFAIVGAGPDGVFGDEPIDPLRTAMLEASLIEGDEAETVIRRRATEDNVVEFGE